MAEDLPFRAEYAKSGRASCKSCKEVINKDDLRLAVMIQSPKFDGRIPNWFHFDCFFIRHRIKTTGDIAHFHSLRWEDQKRIEDKMVGTDSIVESKTKNKRTKKSAKQDDFSTEYAKSNRSTCRGCEQKIDKDDVRISKTDWDSITAYGPTKLWYHVNCFVKNRETLEFYDEAEKLPGFFTLGVNDQKELKKKLKSINKKLKSQNKTETVPTKEQKLKDKKEETKLKKQSDTIFYYRDLLQKNLSKVELQELLEFNDQQIPKGESNILDLLSDCMAFGALEPCPECKDGQLRFRNSGYACGGHLSGWTTCQYTSKTPKRKPFVIPEELLKYSFLRNYDGSVVSERFFRSDLSEPSTSAASLNRSNSTSKPLGNLSVVIVGKLKKSLKELTAKVEELGGKVVSKVTENVVCVITNEEEIKKNSKKIKDAEKANVHVVSEDFLESVQNGGAALMITQHSLCSWGGDPTVKISRFEKKLHEEKMFTKSIPTKMKMTVKGAAAVEPDSGLEDVAHVYEENGNIYNAILGMVDIIKGTNSYYKLQLLAGDRSHQFWVFRSWGRVGTTIGGNKLEEFYGKLDAVTEFKRLYEEKTGNMWEERNNFVKHPNKFYPLDIDYGQDSDPQMKKLEPGVDSKLPKAVQELICLIFDIESMKRQMTEFELDLKKMPLGKLSKKQIEQAYAVLTELQELKNKNENQSKILDASNRFYTLIPHDFGLKKPPLLDNDRIIKSKLEMLDSLLELEVAYKLLKEASGDSSVDPVTQHYNKLKTDIDVLDESSDEYKTINSYIKNTHAKTHDQYTLKLEEVFKISRHGESKRFKPFKNLPNRYLLWHGSRLTNFAGILSQGLRIAPPEAPSTGYMFGKGIYFADMVSKSANYCYTSVQNPVGLLLLCEVALGNMYERTRADYITKLPPNMHSTKGCGATIPDPKQVIKNDDGLVIPAGKPVNSKISNGDLLYNEYIIYDTAQVNIKYLLKVKFNWKR